MFVCVVYGTEELISLSSYLATTKFGVVHSFALTVTRPFVVDASTTTPNYYLAFCVLIAQKSHLGSFSFRPMKKFYRDSVTVKQFPARTYLWIGKVSNIIMSTYHLLTKSFREVPWIILTCATEEQRWCWMLHRYPTSCSATILVHQIGFLCWWMFKSVMGFRCV